MYQQIQLFTESTSISGSDNLTRAVNDWLFKHKSFYKGEPEIRYYQHPENHTQTVMVVYKKG